MDKLELENVVYGAITRFYNKVISPDFTEIEEKLMGAKEELGELKHEVVDVKVGIGKVATRVDLETVQGELSREIFELRGEIGIVKINHEKRITRVEKRLK